MLNNSPQNAGPRAMPRLEHKRTPQSIWVAAGQICWHRLGMHASGKIHTSICFNRTHDLVCTVHQQARHQQTVFQLGCMRPHDHKPRLYASAAARSHPAEIAWCGLIIKRQSRQWKCPRADSSRLREGVDPHVHVISIQAAALKCVNGTQIACKPTCVDQLLSCS